MSLSYLAKNSREVQPITHYRDESLCLPTSSKNSENHSSDTQPTAPLNTLSSPLF